MFPVGSGLYGLSFFGQLDFVHRDAAGNIVRDSKRERIAREFAALDKLGPKVARLPILRTMLESYNRAIGDPGNELVHLYEIRDALEQDYGGDRAAQKALSISISKWKRLGILANVEPLAQGRHRGKHQPQNRRPATKEELDEARSLAREWIEKFADTL